MICFFERRTPAACVSGEQHGQPATSGQPKKVGRQLLGGAARTTLCAVLEAVYTVDVAAELKACRVRSV